MEQKFREKKIGRERERKKCGMERVSIEEGRKEMTWITAKYPFILVT